jgi:biopolymer transport protein ExbB
LKRFVVASCLILASVATPVLAQNGSVLPHDLTVASMYQQADWVVKSVMLILVLASVATLSIWIYKVWELLAGRRCIAQSLQQLAVAGDLAAATALPDPASRRMVELAQQELQRYPLKTRGKVAEGIKERVAALIVRVEAGQQRRLSRGVSVLGSIGAAAPFIGLFGTVWGIMNSFIGIAKAQTTNLAVVAPGIAEALLTTAFGLVAAIPAVLLYNAVTRAIAGYRVRLNDASTQVMCLLSRELEIECATRPSVEAVDGV